jgi:hypothetical protein
MLCSFACAQRCINSFDGVALFADQSTYDKIDRHDNQCMAVWDYNNKPLPIRLNVVNYYLLVLLSLTGLCSLIGKTKILLAEDSLEIPYNSNEGENSVYSKVSKNLYIPPGAMAYIHERSRELCKGDRTSKISEMQTPVELTLQRRFEFDFGGFLSVMMLHFECSNGMTHLVETYGVDQSSWIGRLAIWSLVPFYWLQYLTVRRNEIDTVSMYKEE